MDISIMSKYNEELTALESALTNTYFLSYTATYEDTQVAP